MNKYQENEIIRSQMSKLEKVKEGTRVERERGRAVITEGEEGKNEKINKAK